MTTSPLAQYLYDFPMSLTVRNIAGFTFNASIIPPNYTVTSTATLSGAQLSHNNFTLECLLLGFGQPSLSDIIVTTGTLCLNAHKYYYKNLCSVLGATCPPSNLKITASASLTWLPPPNTNCTFNYTVNITNSSCSMTVYSSSTSLILTDLLTRGQKYSFTVAVTDSTEQHGPWSDQLMVTYDGMYIIVTIMSTSVIV